LSLLVGFCPALTWGQETGITRKHHPWGSFEAGAWTRARLVNETFDESGALCTISETKTTLEKVEKDGVTLRIDALVEVGGNQIQPEPKAIKQGWHGELADQDVKMANLGSGEVVIQGRRIPCKIVQLELVGQASKTTTQIYYSDTVEPYILKRRSTKTDLDGTKTLEETTLEVIDINVPCRLLARVWNTFHVKRVHTHAKGSSTTVAVTSTRVPGGVIRHTSKEFDSDGRLIARSSLELLEYGFEEVRTGLFGRRRFLRSRTFQRFSPYPTRAPGEGP
jgi:hypothetical protein